MAILGAEVRLRNCVGVYSHSAKLFLDRGKAHNLYLGGHHKAEKLLFPMLPSILTFTFYLILRSFLAFLGPIGLFWKSRGG